VLTRDHLQTTRVVAFRVGELACLLNCGVIEYEYAASRNWNEQLVRWTRVSRIFL
jgi:hypothetical protein